MYSQSTYKELLSCSSGVLSAHQQKDSWFGGWWWVFHCFQKTENYPHAHFWRHETVSRPQQSHCKGHCPRPDTRLQGLPLRGQFHTVAPGRADEREGGQYEGSSLTSYPTETGSWTPSPGSSPFPTLLPGIFSPGRRPSCSQRACWLERARGWAPGPPGFCATWQSITASAWMSSPVWGRGGPGDFQEGCRSGIMNNKKWGIINE